MSAGLNALDFGQKADLCVRIKEILRNYPEGSSILKELIQNADDASATDISFVLDLRHHGTEKLWAPTMKDFQGPALLAYNSSKFTKTDFESIQRIGDSLKKETSQGIKTGRFGVGFNSVYHLTDVPQFVSDRYVVMFDPQAKYLPDINPSNPGKIIDFVKSNKAVRTTYQDQFLPLQSFGCDLQNPFDGTLFRLPLRTVSSSRLSRQTYTPERMKEILDQFCQVAPSMLLFLKKVVNISVGVWTDGADAPLIYYTAKVQKMSKLVAQARTFVTTAVAAAALAASTKDSEGIAQQQIVDYELEIASTWHNKEGGEEIIETWYICNQLGGGQSHLIATDPENLHLKLVPWAGVAARMSRTDPSSGHALERKDIAGQVYCFLPLPVFSGLPVHMNGYFELSSNRRDIWSGSDMAGEGALRARWNQSLLEDVIVPCYQRLLVFALKSLGNNPYHQNLQNYYALFPSKETTGIMWQATVSRFYQSIAKQKLFFTRANNGSWVMARTGILPNKHCTADERLKLEVLFSKCTELALLNEIPIDLAKTLLKHSIAKDILTPSTARVILRTKACRDLVLCFDEDTRKDSASFLLEYCLSDLSYENYGQIEGCRLLPLSDGDYGSFSLRNTSLSIQEDKLDQLSQMGFSYQLCASALRKHKNNIEEASMWLLGLQSSGSIKQPTFNVDAFEFAPYFICTDAEKQVLHGMALRACIDTSSCSSRAIQILTDTHFHAVLNVEKLSAKHMARLLPDVLPPEWRNSQYVTWNPPECTHEDDFWSPGTHPPVLWIQKFWQYAHGSLNSNLELFENKCPLVPTTNNRLYMIKRALPMLLLPVNVEESDIPVINVLRKVGVDIANSSLLGGHALALRLVSRYIQEPNRSGILEVINGVVAIRSSKYREVFQEIEVDGRNALRIFLSSEAIDRLTKRECVIVSRLPIYHNYEILRGGELEQSEMLACYGPLSKNNHYLDSKAVRVHPAAIPSQFIYTSSTNEEALLSKLGVSCVNEITFCVEHFLPKIEDIQNSKARDDTLISILLNLPRLGRESKQIVALLSETYCIPDQVGNLRRPCDLYDSDINDLKVLLQEDKTNFPALEYSSPEILSSLRVLGLQTSLSRSKIVECASSLNNDNDAGAEDEITSSINEKAMCLMRYIDIHSKELFCAPEKNFLSVISFRDDKAAVEEIDQFCQDMMGIEWVPVLTAPTDIHLPWRDGGLSKRAFRLPREVRPEEDKWLCSFSLGIVQSGTVQSKVLKSFLGWDKPIDPRVIALQLIRLGQSFTVDVNLNQVMSLQVPKIYQSLAASCQHDSVTLEKVKTLLNGTSWIWVGDCFVSDENVAFVSPVNAKPYLHGVPRDLAMGFGPLLKALGVRDEFSSSDFANVLRKLKDDKNGSMLTRHELEMAVALVQILSDSPTKTANFEIFAPDANGIMTLSSKMVYDDAPWLAKSLPHGNEMLKICPKISNDVAKHVGVMSLRSTLIEEEAEDLLTGFDASSFGQAEPLTGRLHHILELYPEGPGILSELIQNADDARATEFSIFFNTTEYGSNSLLGPQMSKWQGPALYVHNNAVFSQSDFQNLVKLGQASKLEKLSTTGRFGLGFNSVYHFTDLPSFVTGDHVVMFDPHTDYIPRATHQQPGLKLKFSGSRVLEQFHDQFSPYLYFGCDMRSFYNGTLFRFPLRRKEHKSKIKSQPYSSDSVRKLLDQFRANIVHSMIFLRHVKKISVYCNGNDDDRHPSLLYEAFVTKRDDQEWSALSTFLNPALSKEAMYGRLLRTPVSDLPKSTQRIEITSTMPDSETRVDDFLVAQRFGAGEARKIACSKENENMKLIPWGGVAAHINTPVRVGRAFCFLPLPAETGMSVHVHGYFELSSDRRNIWFGDDMAGEGAMRARWNAALLRDVVAPCYCQLLEEAANIFGPSEKDFYALFPHQIPPGPWGILASSFFEVIKSSHLLFSPVNKGSWISPNQAMLVKQDGPMSSASGFTSDSMNRLVDLLLLENIPIVKIPNPALTTLLVDQNCVKECLSSKEVRAHFKTIPGRTIISKHHPSLSDRDDAMFLLDVCMLDLYASQDFADIIGLPLCPMADGKLAIFGGPTDITNIFIGSRWNETMLMKSSISNLLVDPIVVGESDEKRPADIMYHALAKAIRLPSMLRQTNIRMLTPAYFASLLPTILPKEWRGKREVIWTPLEPSTVAVSEASVSEMFVQRLWKLLCPDNDGIYHEEHLASFENAWPLVPTTQPRAKTLMTLRAKMPCIDGHGLSSSLCHLLARIGVRTVDHRILPKPPKKFIQPGSVEGCLRAIHHSVDGNLEMLVDRFRVIKRDSLNELREFLGTFAWKTYRTQNALQSEEELSDTGTVSSSHDFLKIMRALPIYEVYGTDTFQPLSDSHYLVPDELSLFKGMLNSRFLVTNTSREKKLLLSLGVEEREVPTAIIAEQLAHMGMEEKKLSPEIQRRLNMSIHGLYTILAEQTQTPEDLESLRCILQSRPWVWIENRFHTADSVAFRCPQNAAPFLYQVPQSIKQQENLRELWSGLGVREEFGASDFVIALQKLRNSVGTDAVLRKDHLDFAIALLQMLAECDSKIRENAVAQHGPVYVPTEAGILRDSNMVVFNDAEWLQVAGAYEFCHSNLSNTVASKVGVKSLRGLELEGRNDMKEFGCPNAVLVHSLLETYKERQRMFSDLIEFIDELRCSSAEIWFDYRNYPSQSIMHTNMLPLQTSSALCIVMPGAVLDSNQLMDALSVRRAAQRGKLGINSLYHISDCLEVLSGDYLYIVDPSCHYTKSSMESVDSMEGAQGGSTVEKPAGDHGDASSPLAGKVKAYKWFGTNLVDRFPDAFKSFLSLNSGLSVKDKFTGTIIRAALRTDTSAVNDHVSLENDTEFLCNSFKQLTGVSCLFTTFVEKFRIMHAKEGETKTLSSAEIKNAALVRNERQKLLFNDDWQTQGFTRFFTGWKVMKSKFSLEMITFIDVEDKGQESYDVYEIQLALGPGVTRDTAVSLLSADFGSASDIMPIVGIAAHVSRNGSAPDTGSDGIRTGYIMRPAPLPTSTGLPVHIFANFKLHPEGKLLNAGEAKRWNRTLLHELTGNIYVSLLKTLVPLFSKKDNPRELYKVAWPIMKDVHPDIRPFISTELHTRLAERPYFYSSITHQFIKLNRGCFPGKNMPPLAQEYVAKRIDILDVPPNVADDLSEAGISVNRMGPSELRLFLRKNEWNHTDANKIDTCIDLLVYCVADIDANDGESVGAFGEPTGSLGYDQLCGLRLCPCSDGQIGRFHRRGGDVVPPSEAFIIGTEAGITLLHSKLGMFVHPKALSSPKLEAFFSNGNALRTVGILKFTPHLLSLHIGSTLPHSWRRQLKVQWDPTEEGHPSHAWMKQFWSTVDVTDSRMVELFSDYPLVPLTSGHLLSCSLYTSALCIDPCRQNNAKLEHSLVVSNACEEEEVSHDESNDLDLPVAIARKVSQSSATFTSPDDQGADEQKQ